MSLIRIPSEVVSPRSSLEKFTTSDGSHVAPSFLRGSYTRVKVDGTVTMYWFINLPFGDCAMHFDHGV